MFYGERSRAIKETTTGYHHPSTDISRTCIRSYQLDHFSMLSIITINSSLQNQHMFYGEGFRALKDTTTSYHHTSTDISRHASGHISWAISLCFLLLPLILHCRTNTCSMEKGLELSKRQLQAIITQVQTFLDMHQVISAIITQVQTILDMHQVISAGPFLYAFYYYPSFFITEPTHVLWRKV